MTDRFHYHPKGKKQFPIPGAKTLQEALLWAGVDYEVLHGGEVKPGDNILDQRMFDETRRRVEDDAKTNKLAVHYCDGIAATPHIELMQSGDTSPSQFGFNVVRNEHGCPDKWVVAPGTHSEEVYVL